MRRFLLTVVALAALAGPAMAVDPDEQLKDPKLEARAHELSKTLRCVVCQNQTIDDSDASLAHDLRVILRERIAAGDTDDQAVAYLVARYGSFVQMKPPLRTDTLALWFGPLAVLVVGGIGAAFYIRGRSQAPALEAADEAEASALLKSETRADGAG